MKSGEMVQKIHIVGYWLIYFKSVKLLTAINRLIINIPSLIWMGLTQVVKQSADPRHTWVCWMTRVSVFTRGETKHCFPDILWIFVYNFWNNFYMPDFLNYILFFWKHLHTWSRKITSASCTLGLVKKIEYSFQKNMNIQIYSNI